MSLTRTEITQIKDKIKQGYKFETGAELALIAQAIKQIHLEERENYRKKPAAKKTSSRATGLPRKEVLANLDAIIGKKP